MEDYLVITDRMRGTSAAQNAVCWLGSSMKGARKDVEQRDFAASHSSFTHTSPSLLLGYHAHASSSTFASIHTQIVMKDRETGRSRGFGFVTYGTQQEADAAIAALNEQELDGRRIRVNMANSRPPAG
jgi:hypothetical protein